MPLCSCSALHHAYCLVCSCVESALDKGSPPFSLQLFGWKRQFVQRNFLFWHPWQLPLYHKCQSKNNNFFFSKNSEIIVKELLSLNIILGLSSHASSKVALAEVICFRAGRKSVVTQRPQASSCPWVELYLVIGLPKWVSGKRNPPANAGDR